jgi:hypothetical protein
VKEVWAELSPSKISSGLPSGQALRNFSRPMNFARLLLPVVAVFVAFALGACEKQPYSVIESIEKTMHHHGDDHGTHGDAHGAHGDAHGAKEGAKEGEKQGEKAAAAH